MLTFYSSAAHNRPEEEASRVTTPQGGTRLSLKKEGILPQVTAWMNPDNIPRSERSPKRQILGDPPYIRSPESSDS